MCSQEPRQAATRSPSAVAAGEGFDSGGGAPGGFSIIRFQSAEVPDMVYAEQLTGASYIDKQAEVAAYLVALERLTVLSAQPRESAEMIEAVLGQGGNPR